MEYGGKGRGAMGVRLQWLKDGFQLERRERRRKRQLEVPENVKQEKPRGQELAQVYVCVVVGACVDGCNMGTTE